MKTKLLKLFCGSVVLALICISWFGCSSSPDEPLTQFRYTIVYTNDQGKSDTTITQFFLGRQKVSITNDGDLMILRNGNYTIIAEDIVSFTIINEEQQRIEPREKVKQ